jgi:hypothetical protein
MIASTDKLFWMLFGGVWMLVAIAFIAGAFGVNMFSNPNQLEGGSPLLFAAMGIGMLVAGGGVIYLSRRAAVRETRLMQVGMPVTARVLDVRRSRIEINRQSRWIVEYRYEYPKGRELEGKSGGLLADDVWDFKPGDQVQIKVDPQKPEDSIFLGKA